MIDTIVYNQYGPYTRALYDKVNFVINTHTVIVVDTLFIGSLFTWDRKLNLVENFMSHSKQILAHKPTLVLLNFKHPYNN